MLDISSAFAAPAVGSARRDRGARDTLRFVERAENVLFVGSPGMGKTHLAVALGIEAIRAGREVRFVDCARLVEDLEDASSRDILKKRLRCYAHSRLPIIDELGYLDVGSAGADLLFQLISTRYERDCGQGVPPLPPGQDNRQVLQVEGPAEGRARQGVTGIGDNTLANR